MTNGPGKSSISALRLSMKSWSCGQTDWSIPSKNPLLWPWWFDHLVLCDLTAVLSSLVTHKLSGNWLLKPAQDYVRAWLRSDFDA
jgi:hypothetical protein